MSLPKPGCFHTRTWSRFRGVLAATVCLTVAGLGVSPVSAGPPTKDLERKKENVRKREGQLRNALGSAQATEAQLAKRLERIAVDLGSKKGEAEAAQLAADEATAAADRVSAEVAELKRVLESRKATFNRRAVQAYMGGAGRPLDDLSVAGGLLSMPKDFSDAARRSALMQKVSHADGDALGDLTDTRNHLAMQEQVLIASRETAKERAAQAVDALRAVSALKAEQERTRSALQSKIVHMQAEADSLAAEQARLEQLIRERLEALARERAARAARNPFASRKVTTGQGVSTAGFIWPVQGIVTSNFGARWGRMHTGIDIAAPGGTPIVASKGGEVIYAGWLGGYGNLVVVDHGDSVVTLYAHQSRIGVVEGQPVDQGQVVGFVGTTGNSTGNHLHFEVRVDTHPEDPRKYLP
jgi:murein DD-endopeptidase MepM/ murein hydrolase activator NlpD